MNAPIRFSATALLAGLSLLLSGCFITPGKFTSELQLTEADQFTFTYEGEIFFLGLSRLAEMGAANETFEPVECYDEDTFDERECSQAELDEQRAEWDAGAETRAVEAREKAAQLSAMMGGIDPTDPDAAEDLAALLQRHNGWNRVESKGDGVFDISYSITGSLSHDFMFPVIEGFPTTNPFVQMIIRDGNVVRINAPGFAAQNDANPLGGLSGGLGGIAALGTLAPELAGQESQPTVPVIEGTFTIVTTGNIRANNTDEGSTPSDRGEVLTWAISPRTTDAPTALIDLPR